MKSEFIDLRSYDRVAGQVVLPGSKSISNRVLLLAALAKMKFSEIDADARTVFIASE